MTHLRQDHLNEEQIAELVSASPRERMEDPSLAALQAHAAECAECSAEIDTLRDSLEFFREASSAFAQTRLEGMAPVRVPAPRPVVQYSMWWAAAAAAVSLAALLPLQMNLQRSDAQRMPQTQTVDAPSPARTAESDEALLEDVHRKVSQSVPSPLAALVDPINSSQNANQRTN